MVHDLKLPSLHQLTHALLVFTGQHGHSSVVMQGFVEDSPQGPVITDPKPVTRDLIDSLIRLSSLSSLQIVPEHVVAVSTSKVAWVVPGTPRTLLFAGSPDAALQEIDGLSFPQPTLLFVGSRHSMRVFALPSTVTRPVADTPLWAAPYLNIFTDHGVCHGSMRLPSTLTPENCLTYSDVFFGSNFLKPAGTTRRWPAGMTHRELWDAALAAGEFKDEWLQPTTHTLKSVCGGVS